MKPALSSVAVRSIAAIAVALAATALPVLARSAAQETNG